MTVYMTFNLKSSQRRHYWSGQHPFGVSIIQSKELLHSTKN